MTTIGKLLKRKWFQRALGKYAWFPVEPGSEPIMIPTDLTVVHGDLRDGKGTFVIRVPTTGLLFEEDGTIRIQVCVHLKELMVLDRFNAKKED